MSVRLIYHTSESASGGVSPFDEAVLKVVTHHDVSIACPYLTLEYLQRITSLSKTWQVITDVEEWLAMHSQDDRSAIQGFISQHKECFHHVRDLHAKVVITGTRALVGSANLTHTGITQRREIAVMFEDEPQVKELLDWFDHTWSESSLIDLDELERYVCQIRSTPPSVAGRPPRSIPSSAHPIRSRLKTERLKQPGRISPLSEAFVRSNLDYIFVAYAFVYIQIAIDALERSPGSKAVVVQPYEKRKAFTSAQKAARLYRKLTEGKSIPILMTLQPSATSD